MNLFLKNPDEHSGKEFYIVSVLHTKRSAYYITFWRPGNKGYALPLSWAGKYGRDTVLGNLGYYNQGIGALAVDAVAIEKIAVDPKPGIIDGNAGPVVTNTKKSWDVILANIIQKPTNEPRPQYRGAPRLTV